jgi:hypothetical protein
MFETVDRVELPVPVKVALDVAPLPERVVMLVVPTPPILNAFELPIFNELKTREPPELPFVTDMVFPVPSKLTEAVNLLTAEPYLSIEEVDPPSRFKVCPPTPIVNAVVVFPERNLIRLTVSVAVAGGEKLIVADCTGGLLISRL